MIYEDLFGYQYQVQETLNSKLSTSGLLTYKVHVRSRDGDMWLPVSRFPSLRSRWWRTQEAGEKYLKDFAEKQNWKLIEEDQHE